jgi:hypothetical protein
VSLPLVSRAEIIQRVRGWAVPGSLQVKRVDRIEAKLMMHGELRDAIYSSPPSEPGVDPGRIVWAVAFAGQYSPQFARGREYAWGVLVFDPVSGQPIGSHAGPDGTAWPPYWDKLPDRDPTRP